MPEGQEVPRPVFGLALRAPKEHAIESLMKTLEGPPFSSTDFLRRLASSSGLRKLESDPDLVWFRWREADDRPGFTRDSEQIREVLSDLNEYRDDRLLANLSTHYFRRSSTSEENLGRVLGAWQSAIHVPKVLIVPPVRDIVSDGEPRPDTIDPSGRGLPQLLQTWQAPAAHRHREDTKRFESINRFAREVLEDESALITVPYNRSTVHLRLGDRVLPITNLGKGISQVIIMAVIATYYDDHLLCVEEPEVNLHPIMLRKLIRYLANETSNQYLLSTHSAALLDNPDSSVLRVAYEPNSGTTIQAALTPVHRAAIAQHLGYRASDILQSNAVIWVEGSSDRVYINHWISQVDSRLVEGIHYSVMFYGGRLLAHLTGEEWIDAPEGNVQDFISLIRINRNMVIVIDSDKRSDDSDINDTKKRVSQSFEKNGGIAWITAGREIENYVSRAVINQAIADVHPDTHPAAKGTPYEDVFASIRRKDKASEPGKVANPDKVRVAERVLSINGSRDVLDLEERVTALVNFLRQANDLSG